MKVYRESHRNYGAEWHSLQWTELINTWDSHLDNTFVLLSHLDHPGDSNCSQWSGSCWNLRNSDILQWMHHACAGLEAPRNRLDDNNDHINCVTVKMERRPITAFTRIVTKFYYPAPITKHGIFGFFHNTLGSGNVQEWIHEIFWQRRQYST